MDVVVEPSIRSMAASPASGPSAIAIATPRLSSTTGEGLDGKQPVVEWRMRAQRVSSGRRAVACSTAIVA